MRRQSRVHTKAHTSFDSSRQFQVAVRHNGSGTCPMGDRQHRNSPANIRRDWVNHVVAEAQRTAGRSLVIDPEQTEATLLQFIGALPAPANHLERLILRAMLFDVAWKFGSTIHRRTHRRHSAKCRFVPAALMGSLVNAPIGDPEAMFLPWVNAFCAEFSRTHPASVAARVAGLIRRDYQHPWSLDSLADQFHVTVSQLRRAFQREFGVSIHDYQRSRRVIEALSHVSEGKIDAIALEVGYKSKKDFYRAFQAVTGVTPMAFRRLSDEHASRIVKSVSATASRRTIAADRHRARQRRR